MPARIVVVDDEPDTLGLLREQVEGPGFEVAAFETGADALAHLREHEADLVLLDRNLGSESGLDVCRAIRALPAQGYLPVILLTSMGGTSNMVEGLEAGADEYLVKPHKLPELLARIRSMLRLKAAMDKLRQADAFKEELLAVTAHDLRNPASAVMGFAEAMLYFQTTSNEERRRSALQQIVSAAKAMHKLLDRLYNRTLIEAAEFAASKTLADPAALASAVVARNQNLAAARGIRLTCDGALPAGYRAPLDPVLFDEIAANLVGNALKFTPDGGAVRVRLASGGGRLALAVEDNGPGIAPEDQKAIFEKFRRAAGASGTQGMGLGLAIVSKFARLHGGEVRLSSAPGRGSAFVVYFPEAEPAGASPTGSVK